MTDVTLVLAKLTTLRAHTDRAERRRSASIEEFRTDVDRQDALALSLIVALQEGADISTPLDGAFLRPAQNEPDDTGRNAFRASGLVEQSVPWSILVVYRGEVS